MSTARNYFPETGKETSSFAMTCNRLSSFLKEKRSLRHRGIDENFDLKGKPNIFSPSTEKNTTTIDFLSSMENTIHTDESNKAGSNELIATADSKTAQMTIFYQGQVVVFDCISTNKARDLMLAASQASKLDKPVQNPGLQVNGLDLPIARRGSLHRFLAKRKDKASVRGPYQLQIPSNHELDLNL